MPDRAATLGMMGDMLGQEQVPFSAQTEAVTCRACRLPIDPQTGEPLQPPTRDNVEAVRAYMNEAGTAEMGGQQLETSLDGLMGG